MLSVPSHASRYALLIGISDYKYIRDMDGPVNDVTALKDLLTDLWDFQGENVSLLVNEQATKRRINTELNRLLDRSQEGDHIFIYYSGHGTSRLDARSNWPLPYTTGALIPYDYRPEGDAEDRLKQLVIGRWELKPLLEALDRGKRTVFVAIDSCFSGNTVRNQLGSSPLPYRYIDLAGDGGSRALSMRGKPPEHMFQAFRSGRQNAPPYPYHNVFFLSASGEHEFASDITAVMLPRFPTLDGKPHGAFTDALLRALAGTLHSDTNHDNRLTYSELHRAVRHFMDGRGYAQTPRALPILDKDTQELANQAVFDMESMPVKSGPDEENQYLRVKVPASLQSLQRALSQLQGVQLADSWPDLIVLDMQGEISLKTLDGTSILRAQSDKLEGMLRAIEHQVLVKSLVNRPGSGQRFNVVLDLAGPRQAGMAIEGETISFSVSSERDAYYMLLAIDPTGTINVIYPASTSQIRSVKAGEVVRIPDEQSLDSTTIQPPFGREYLVLIAFEQQPGALAEIIGAKINAFSPGLSVLKRLLDENRTHQAHAVLQLETIGYTKGATVRP